MKKLTLLLLFAASLCIYSCQDDIIGEGETTEIIQEPTITISSSVSGIVTDESGVAIENVEIEYSNSTYYTDLNGYFKIDNAIAPEDGALLSFNKMGYFENFKFFYPSEDALSFLRIQMIDREESASIDAGSGGVAEVVGGARISFPPNAFQDENQLSYQGNVTIYAHWYDPASPDFSPSMPGDLRAVDAAGQLVQLSTFGMMAVELRSENGRELQLAEGTRATLEFPIPQALANSAPTTIETWSLDEQTGYWLEEQTAQLEGNSYIAEVEHFSFWNCDAPFPLVNIFGKLVGQDGQPLPNLRICIIAFNGAQTGYGWTDSAGGFQGKVPKDQELVLLVKDECGNVVFEEAVGPFTNDASFGEITIDIGDKINVSGRLVCNGSALPEAYARISLDNGAFYIAEADDNGFFNQSILSCQSVNLSLQAFDIENARSSQVFDFNISAGQAIDAGDIEVCNQLDEFIIFKIDDSEEVLIENPDARILNDNLIISSGQDSIESFLEMIIPDVKLGTSDQLNSLYAFILYNSNNTYLDFRCGSGGSACADVQIEISLLESVGGFVEGSFMAEALSPNLQIISVMGSFRIRIDDISEAFTISGKAWIDQNGDGVRNSGETLLSGVRLVLTGGTLNMNRTTPANGEYLFNNILPGTYDLFANTPSGYIFTLPNQGGDDTVDSDFTEQGLTITIVDQDLERLDVGFIPNNLYCDFELVNDPSCDDPNSGEGLILIEGGALPYQVWLNNQTYGISDETRLEVDGLTAGSYTLRIEDDNGVECQTEFTVYESSELDCTVITEDTGCDGQEQGSAYVEVSGSSNAYEFLWSNGLTSQSIAGLATGIYIVTVTDENGCSSVCEGFVQEGFFDISVSILDQCDNGQSISQLAVEVVGGQQPYEIEWTHNGSDEMFTEFQGSGSTSVIVTSENGCFAEQFIDIPEARTRIGDRVWLDEPGGTEDVFDVTTESGVEGVYIELYSVDNQSFLVDSTSTNSQGLYEFIIADPGDYQIKVYEGPEYEIVNQNIGSDDSLDSDIDPDTGFSDIFTVGQTCVNNKDIDAGLKEN